MSFGQRLEQILDAKGLTRADLCRMTGLTSGHLTPYIKNPDRSPNLSTACKISLALNVSIDYLAGLIDEPRPIDWDGVAQPPVLNPEVPLTRELGEALGQLNETGLQEATKRVKEMTLVSAYVGEGKNGGDSGAQEVAE